MEKAERLQKYAYDDYAYITNFENYNDAVKYCSNHQGNLVEIGFTDGADTPVENNAGNLIATQKVFRVGLAPEYEVLYSDDPKFQEMAEEVLEFIKRKENDVAPEDWISDQNIASGDRIIVVKDGQVNTVTTRERIKYLMQGNVYELAVKVANTEIKN